MPSLWPPCDQSRRRRDSGTRRAYRVAVRHFLHYVNALEGDVTPAILSEFKSWLAGNGASHATAQSYSSVARNLLGWAVRHDKLPGFNLEQAMDNAKSGNGAESQVRRDGSMKFEIGFTFERETKNTVRFQEDPRPGESNVGGTIYVNKNALPTPFPEKIKVTIEVADSTA